MLWRTMPPFWLVGESRSGYTGVRLSPKGIPMKLPSSLRKHPIWRLGHRQSPLMLIAISFARFEQSIEQPRNHQGGESGDNHRCHNANGERSPEAKTRFKDFLHRAHSGNPKTD